jgi:mono/diheme cytochrome c family protein
MSQVMKSFRLGFAIALTLGCASAQDNNDRHAIGVRASKILATNCVACHGGLIKNAGLDLRKAETILKGGERGSAVSPGNPDLSRLYRQVAHLEGPHMPPGKKLDDADIAALKLWIERGIPFVDIVDQKEEEARAALAKLEDRPITPVERKWWAFQKVAKPAMPAVQNKAWARNAVDQFLLAAMEKKSLTPSPEADKRALTRRAYLDLTGLPPTLAEVKEFVADQRPDAFDRLVDKLLDSPHYGERWARHWLDIVRFSDSGGFEYDRERDNAWRYRDYVIRAFNNDKPYDRFLKEQLAGDELYPNNVEARVDRLPAARRGEQHQDRADADGRAGRHRGDHGQFADGRDHWLRALPQPQVRPDPAEGLLPDAGRVLRYQSRGAATGDRRATGQAQGCGEGD